MEEQVYLMTQGQYEHLKQQLELILKKLQYDAFERESKWMTVQETMDLLQIGRTTLWRYKEDNKLTASKIGKKLYFNRDEIENFLLKNTA